MKIRFVLVLLALMMLAGTAKADMNCTDAGSDGILNNIIKLNSTTYGGSSNCTVDGTNDYIEIQYAANNGTNNTILIEPGSYDINASSINLSNKKNITFLGNSTNATLVNLTKQTGSTSNGFNITGSSNISFQNFTIKINSTGFIANTYGDAFNITNSTIILFKYMNITRFDTGIYSGLFTVCSDSTYSVTIEHTNIFYNRAGILVCGLKNSVIRNSVVSNSQSWMGIDIQKNSDNVTVENNTLNDNANAGFKLYSGSHNHTVKNNEVYSNQDGLWMMGGNNNLFINNSIYSNTRYGIQIDIIYNNVNGTITNNRIYQNTLHGIYFTNERYNYIGSVNITSNTINGNGGDGIWKHAPINYTVIVKNNIITNNTGFGVRDNNSAEVNIHVVNSYNDVWNNTAGNYSNTSAGTGDISFNPLFANVSAFDFHLQSIGGRWNGSEWVNDTATSPAIDTGDPSSDYSNEPEPNGNRINMGSYGNTQEASRSVTTAVPPSIPGIPINIASITGKYFINATWQPGEGNVTTDSYNVSVNGSWYNGTTCPCINITTISGNYTNVTVWAWNNSGAGNLSTSSISMNTTLYLYSISGHVIDNGFGYNIADVSITSSEGSTTTNSTGHYVLSDFLNGTYNLTFSKSGYEVGTLSVTVSGSNATDQDIILNIIETVRSRYYSQSCSDILTLETFFFAIFGVAISVIVIFGALSIIKGREISMDFLIGGALVVFIGLIVITVIPFLIELIEC